MTFTVYHTCASRPDVEQAARSAPNVRHGVAAIPERLSHHPDHPWMLDNGAYRAWNAGEEWSEVRFRSALSKVDRLDERPAFVVLPDVVGDADATERRGREWVETFASYSLTPYGVVQPGDVREQVEALPGAVEGVLVGGAGGANARSDWRRRPLDDGRPAIDHVVEHADRHGLDVHVGRPGDALGWYREHGVDSVDTASIVRNGYWHRLRRLDGASERQLALGESQNGPGRVSRRD